jgi:hypothetical protein
LAAVQVASLYITMAPAVAALPQDPSKEVSILVQAGMVPTPGTFTLPTEVQVVVAV